MSRNHARDETVTAESIEDAQPLVSAEFRDTPQFLCEPLSERLGREVVLKVETLNPIRSFKGRGADRFVQQLDPGTDSLVCASAGNFGQGLAYAASRRGVDLEVFAAETASPLKIERMRRLGARVTVAGRDFDDAKAIARERAALTERPFVEDGREPAITEGAGTIAVELGRWSDPFDAVVVPVGNGALINGIGRWFKERRSGTRVVGVSPEQAPAMARSFRSQVVVETGSADTIADGVAVRVPVPQAVQEMRRTTAEMLLVSEHRILEAMRTLAWSAGLVVEPAGAVALAGLEDVGGERVAVMVTGSNVAEDDARRWLLGN